MNVVVIDISGGVPQNTFEGISQSISVGDHVLLFDTKVYDRGIMHSAAAITGLALRPQGGTAFEPVLSKLKSLNYPPETMVVVHTDDYLCDTLPLRKQPELWTQKKDTECWKIFSAELGDFV